MNRDKSGTTKQAVTEALREPRLRQGLIFVAQKSARARAGLIVGSVMFLLTAQREGHYEHYLCESLEFNLKMPPDWRGSASAELLGHLQQISMHQGADDSVAQQAEHLQAIAALCTQYVQHFGAAELGKLFGTTPDGLSPGGMLLLLDSLRAAPGHSFPWQYLEEFLQALPVDWDAFTGEDLADLFSSTLLYAKQVYVQPREAGAMIGRVISSAHIHITVDILAPVVSSLWSDGYAYGGTLGAFLSGLLPDPDWAIGHAGRLACALTKGCLDCEELDELDFQAMDAGDVSSANPAVRIGLLLDALVPGEGQGVAGAAHIAREMHDQLGDRWGASAGRGSGQEARGCGLFVGRVLMQLRFARESADGEGQQWGLSEALSLACALCSAGHGPFVRDAEDWRAVRSNHAFFVGDILRQLRSSWGDADISMLVTALASPSNFPQGTSLPPPRIVAEVLEALGANYWVATRRPLAQPTENEAGSSTSHIASPDLHGMNVAESLHKRIKHQ